MTFPIFCSNEDALIEIRITQRSLELQEHLKTVEYTYQLFPLPFQNSCCFLLENKLCEIYKTRPQVCRRFEAGCKQCLEARKHHCLA